MNEQIACLYPGKFTEMFLVTLKNIGKTPRGSQI